MKACRFARKCGRRVASLPRLEQLQLLCFASFGHNAGTRHLMLPCQGPCSAVRVLIVRTGSGGAATSRCLGPATRDLMRRGSTRSNTALRTLRGHFARRTLIFNQASAKGARISHGHEQGKTA
ncbi:hypothetical protein TRVL_04666 [Trypanosoma vivax]|nr:hypothetical protein TRVL_04666 [Trypanosoma vivax]